MAALVAAAVAAPAAGAQSADVAALQVALRAHGLYAGTVDGAPGPLTTARRAPLPGAPRPRRRRHRRPRDAARARPARPAAAREAGALSGAFGWDVAALQFLLGRHGFPSGAVDGDLGPRTGAALRRFQAWAGLGADGLAGPATLSRLRAPPPASPLLFALPVAAPAGDRFGPRGNGFHPGVDFPAAAGTRVAAAGRGCVSFAGWSSGGYGNLVVVEHRLGMTSWYAHLSSIAVARGTCVVAGTADRPRRLDRQLDRPAPAFRAAPARRGGRAAV